MPGWSWTYGGTDGAALDAAAVERAEGADDVTDDVPRQPAAGFPVQADAESWLGESWRRLLAAGVEEASLLHEQERVYGPIPLRPPA